MSKAVNTTARAYILSEAADVGTDRHALPVPALRNLIDRDFPWVNHLDRIHTWLGCYHGSAAMCQHHDSFMSPCVCTLGTVIKGSPSTRLGQRELTTRPVKLTVISPAWHMTAKASESGP
jgi:hypothetical protein